MKIVVAHSGTQHSMRVAEAFKRSGHDVTYITTVYNKPGSLTSKLMSFLGGDNLRRAEARRLESIPDANVVQMCELYGLLMLLVKRLDRSKILYYYMENKMRKKFGIQVAKYSRNHDLLYMFDTQSYHAFNWLKKNGSQCKTVLDYSAAFSKYSVIQYEKIFSIFPQYKDTLFNERAFLWNRNIINSFNEEPNNADRIIVASSFVKRSLTDYGVKGDKISIIPYGSTVNLVYRKHNPSDVLKVLYIGNVTVMKGIPFIFKALKEISNDNIQVTFVGAVSQDIIEMSEGDRRCIFIGRVPHADIGTYLSDADLFLFPSLSDGFGFAPLEAMQFGIPCVVSRNAGVSDLITEQCGFIINEADSSAIRQTLIWALNNRAALVDMREEVYKVANLYTWDLYKESLNKAIIL